MRAPLPALDSAVWESTSTLRRITLILRQTRVRLNVPQPAAEIGPEDEVVLFHLAQLLR